MAKVRTGGCPECPGTDVDDVSDHPEWACCRLPHVITDRWDAEVVHDLLVYVCGSTFTGAVGQVRAIIIYVLFDSRREVCHEADSGGRPGR